MSERSSGFYSLLRSVCYIIWTIMSLDLARKVFTNCNGSIERVTAIPYTTWIMECVK